MIRKLKAVGLALTVACAFGAVLSSAASAQNGRLTSDGPATLDMTEIAGQANAFTVFGGTTDCPGSTFTGHKYNVTPHEFIPSGAETITITPEYTSSSCQELEEGKKSKLTVTLNGCDYVLHLGGTVKEVADTYATTLDVVCPVGKSIIKDVYFAENNENLKICERTIGSQSGLSGGTITDKTNGDLEIHGTYGGLRESRSGLCGSETTETGAIDVNLTVKGTNEAGSNTGIALSHL